MGLFDELRCEAALPGDANAECIFQTKSLPAPCLLQLVITKDGRLRDQASRDLEPQGELRCGTVETGEDAGSTPVYREYRAYFADGQLLRIEQARAEDAVVPPHRESLRWYAPSAAAKPLWRTRLDKCSSDFCRRSHL